MLRTKDIHLINTDTSIVLFYHAATMQMYPLDREDDKDLVEFLEYLSANGKRATRKKYSSEKYEEILNFVNETIASGPRSKYSRLEKDTIAYSQIVLPIAASCNLACPYCFAQTDGGFHFGSFNEKKIEDTIDFIVAHRNKMPVSITFFGGEPLLRFDLMKHTVKYVNEKYKDEPIGYSITTNGTLVNDEIIQFFKDNKVAVLVSIDGPDNEFNVRHYKDGTKSINDVLKNIKKFQEAKVPIELRATLLNINPYICQTFQFFEEMKVPFSIIFAFSSENTSHHYADYDENTMSSIEKQMEDLYLYYAKKVRNHELIYNKRCSEIMNILRYRVKRNLSCAAGRTTFTITSKGDIFSCAHFMNNKDRIIGNIYNETPLTEKWNDFTPTPMNNREKCPDCWVRNLCNGGCMAQLIHAGRKNTDPLPEDECHLTKAENAFYLKLSYLIMATAKKDKEEKAV